MWTNTILMSNNSLEINTLWQDKHVMFSWKTILWESILLEDHFETKCLSRWLHTGKHSGRWDYSRNRRWKMEKTKVWTFNTLNKRELHDSSLNPTICSNTSTLIIIEKGQWQLGKSYRYPAACPPDGSSSGFLLLQLRNLIQAEAWSSFYLMKNQNLVHLFEWIDNRSRSSDILSMNCLM